MEAIMSKKSRTKKSAGQKVSKPSKAGKNWVLAMDPFSDLNLEPLVTFAKAAAAKTSGRLIGAYVLSPESLNWTGEFSGPWIAKYKPVAEKKVAELKARFGIEVEVIPCRSTGLSATVETLVKFGKKVKAEGLVVGTHGRSGLERWVLGSFAETLVLAAGRPVVVINPAHSVPKEIRRIVVPIDLSPATIKFVPKIGEWAKSVDAEVELYYKLPDPLDPILQQGVYAVGGGWVSVQSYLDEDTKEKEETLKGLVRKLEAKGVKAKWSLDTTSPSLIQGAVAYAEKTEADLIAVLTQSGKLTTAVLGSVARQLIRTSSVPVLIFR